MAAELWDSAGLAWWRLLRSVGNGSMILVSTTDVTCPGHKESSIPIKMEKLILKGRGGEQRDVETNGFKQSFMRRAGVHLACKTAHGSVRPPLGKGTSWWCIIRFYERDTTVNRWLNGFLHDGPCQGSAGGRTETAIYLDMLLPHKPN